MYELAFLQMPNRGISVITVDHKQFTDHRTLLLHLADLFICFRTKSPSEHVRNRFILTIFL